MRGVSSSAFVLGASSVWWDSVVGKFLGVSGSVRTKGLMAFQLNILNL
jgi:hypothetical protein